MNDAHRGAFTTADAGEAAERPSRFIGRAQIHAPAEDRFQLTLSWAAAGPVVSRRAQVGWGSTVRMAVESPQTNDIPQVSDGTVTVGTGGEHHRLDATPHMMPQNRCTSSMEATDLTIVVLDHDWVQDHAGELLQQEDFRLQLTGTSPHHQAVAGSWASAVGRLHEVLDTPRRRHGAPDPC